MELHFDITTIDDEKLQAGLARLDSVVAKYKAELETTQSPTRRKGLGIVIGGDGELVRLYRAEVDRRAVLS